MKKILLLITLLLFTVACSNNQNHEKGEHSHNDHQGHNHMHNHYVAQVDSENINYEQDGKAFLGYMSSLHVHGNQKRPGILIIHPWEGMTDFTRKEADKYAKAGFVVFAMDMYGTDVKINSTKDAARVAGGYRNNRKLMRSRVEKALEVLKANKDVDVNNIGVVGYCFGGDAAIDYMLYTKAFKAGVSIHGFYKSPLNATNSLNGALELHHGEADTLSTMADFNKFKSQHPEVESYLYKDAGHAYTVDSSPNYNPEDAKLTVRRSIEFLKKNLK